jgi:hypothetical protein
VPNDPKKYPVGFKFVTQAGRLGVIEHEVAGLWRDGTYHVVPGVCSGDRWISDQIDAWVESSFGQQLQQEHYNRGDDDTTDAYHARRLRMRTMPALSRRRDVR